MEINNTNRDYAGLYNFMLSYRKNNENRTITKTQRITFKNEKEKANNQKLRIMNKKFRTYWK